MKIAVCLTGLYNIDPVNIKKVFKIFECIAEKSNVQFDFYMQFWNKSNYYFYDVSDEVYHSPEFIKLPTHLYPIHTELIEYIRPKDILGLNYTDVASKSNLKTDGSYIRDENNAMSYKYGGPTFVDVGTFDNQQSIKNWCARHNCYVNFVNRGAQFYALQEIVKTVPKNTYDAILKWRYDIVCNYQKFCNDFHANFSITPNTLYVPHIFRKKKNENIEELRGIISKNDEYVYGAMDMFMYANDNSFRKFSNDLLDFSIIDFDNATKLFRNSDKIPFMKYSNAAPMEEASFLNKIHKEKFIIRQIGTYDTRIIHPMYTISDSYYASPMEELNQMDVYHESRYKLYKDVLHYERGEFNSENNSLRIKGESIFKLK